MVFIDVGVDILEVGSVRCSIFDVLFYDDGVGLGISSVEDEIRYFNVVNIIGLVNLEDGFGVGLVFEELVIFSKD